MVALGAVAIPSTAHAYDPPWERAEAIAHLATMKSGKVRVHDVPIEAGPSAKTDRRGAAALGAHVPIVEATRGPGCKTEWLRIDPDSWICGDAVDILDSPPPAPKERQPLTAPYGLPYEYYFVGKEGSWGYASLRDADEASPTRQLEPGFAVAGVSRKRKGGEHYLQTSRGIWIPLRDLKGPVSPISFRGEVVEDGRLDFGWIIAEPARVYSKPHLRARTKETRPRLSRVPLLEESQAEREVFLRIGEEEWVRARDLRRPTLAEPPEEISEGERWIDVELASQTLVAYEGKRPIFATLVSTGIGAQGSATATPKGVHRIWVKLHTTGMSNLSENEAEHYYAIDEVPYVQFFSRGVGLHATFWHRGFGHVRSQGCVNLAPLDAERLFELTSPSLPTGWHAVLPTETEKGTVIRVR